MLRIGLFIQDLVSEYSKSVVEGAKRYCLENNIQLFVLLLRGKNCNEGLYDYQYFACKNLATKENLDGIFVVTNTYCKFLPAGKHEEAIKELTYLPIVSFGIPIPGITSVTGEEKTAFRELFEHLEKNHGCKNIYFMGPDTNSKDIIERFEVYKQFQKSRNQDYENKTLYADFISEHAKNVLRSLKVTKDNIPFDALVCCTDDLAFGCLDYCKENNIRVPEDVIITGFDNQERCSYSKPSLTSVDMCIEEQCYESAKLLHQNIINPNGPKEHVVFNAKVMYRQSCGCSIDKRNSGFVEGQYFQLREQVYRYQYFLQDLQVTDETEKVKSIFIDNYKKFGIESCVCCLYDHPILLKKNEEFILPEKVSVFFAYDKDKIYDYKSDFYINPSIDMYPEDFKFADNKEIIVTALFDHEYQYGYILYTPGDLNLSTYELLTTITGTSLASNSVFAEKVHETEKLSSETKSLESTTYFDEMTGVLNRRGLYKYSLPAMKSALERGLTGSIIFGDMDHLKQINDRFGHEAGDRAINGEVEILKTVFRTQDIIARIGGDEFVIVACGLKAVTYPKVIKRLIAATEKYNNVHDEPFDISISLGFVEFNNENNNLDVLMKKADEEQYKHKVLHHRNRE